ncbi:hypothetical protein PoB_000420400 [Plakobranchus ocellatus]|uniref:REJ domain-containing protein n=1 Tax=Plakobranchus ocellatus TaxID=259542 RepID=A0AAV3Y3Z5_9GAST|nr:hypothetical protein PoB_000420400 [Plakobranchus ocellatus]
MPSSSRSSSSSSSSSGSSSNSNSSSSSSSSSDSTMIIVAAVVGFLVGGAAVAALVYFCIFQGLWLSMPCAWGTKDGARSKVSSEDREPDVPTYAKVTGLTATAITTPGHTTFDYFRHLETAQSTHSAITASNLQADLLLEEQKPRRLPALDPSLN